MDVTWSPPTPGKTVLLGPNGAGKSTLIGLMAGALKPQAGVVTFTERVGSAALPLRSHVAWMPQNVVAVRGLKVREQVALAAWLGGMSTKVAEESTSRTLNDLNLNDFADRRVETLSGGQLRRVGLAEVLVRDVDTVLLDEPTAGLDPAQRAGFRHLLAAFPGDLVVSTHQLDDIAELYDHVAVLVGGSVVFSGTRKAFFGSVPNTAHPSAEEVFSHFVPDGQH